MLENINGESAGICISGGNDSITIFTATDGNNFLYF